MSNYYWVNQGASFKDARQAGCLWAPETDGHGANLNHWQTMVELQPGDVVLTYADGFLWGYAAIRSRFVNSVRPYLSKSPYSPGQGGRLVFCDFIAAPAGRLPIGTITSDKQLVQELSTGSNVVLTIGGTVAQKYLCPISQTAAMKLLSLLGFLGVSGGGGSSRTAPKLKKKPAIAQKRAIQLVNARVGQGWFRDALLVQFHGKCPITGLAVESLLRASHIQPWCRSCDEAKLDPQNGLLLAAGVDAAFDCGYVSFDTSGALLVSPSLPLSSLAALGLPVGASLPQDFLTSERLAYLDYHRRVVFKK